MRHPAPAELHEASYANPADVIRQLHAAMESMQATLRPRCTDDERREAFVVLQRWFLVTESQVLERVKKNGKAKNSKTRTSGVLRPVTGEQGRHRRALSGSGQV